MNNELLNFIEKCCTTKIKNLYNIIKIMCLNNIFITTRFTNKMQNYSQYCELFHHSGLGTFSSKLKTVITRFRYHDSRLNLKLKLSILSRFPILDIYF